MSEDELPQLAASPPGEAPEQADARDVTRKAGNVADGGDDGNDADEDNLDGDDADGDDIGTDGDVAPANDVLWRVAAEIRASKRFEALVPASQEERAQVVAAVLAQVQKKKEESKASEKVVSERAASEVAAPVRPPWWRFPWWRFSERTVRMGLLGAVALVVLVVGVVLLVPWRAPPEEERSIASLPTYALLPPYAMTVAGEETTRGDSGTPSASPVEVRPKTRLVLKLTPAQPEPDVARRFVLVHGGQAMLLNPVVSEANGTLTIDQEAKHLLGVVVDGEAELVVFLGRVLPDNDTIRRLALRRAELPQHVQQLRRALRLVSFPHPAIEVLLSGCYAVASVALGSVHGAYYQPTPPSRCEVKAGARLLLWVDVPVEDRVQLLVGRDDRTVPGEPREGGLAFQLEVPSSAGSLAVRVGGAAVATWELTPATIPAAVQAFDAAWSAGKHEAAAAALAALPDNAPEVEQLEVLRRSAKAARWREQPDEEQKLRREAIKMARELGQISAEIDETVAVVYRLAETHELVEAAQLMDRLDTLGSPHAEGAMYREMARGQLDTELGSLASALQAQRRAYTIAVRIGSPKVDFIRGPMADVLHALGRQGEAEELIKAEIQRGEAEGDSCGRIDALTTSGWVLRETNPRPAQQLTEDAVQLAAEHCTRLLPVALVNQGWALAAAGHFGAARAALERLERLGRSDERRVTAWRLRLQAELLLEEDPLKAAQYAQQLEVSAKELCSSELAYEAQLLGARAKAALRQPEEATVAFAKAEQALARWSRMVPLGEGRAAFLHRHEQLARAAIPFFLERARLSSSEHSASNALAARAALAGVVRRSLARFTASLADSGVARADRRTTGQRAAARRLAQTIEQTSRDWPVGADGVAALGLGGVTWRSSLSDVCQASEEVDARSVPALDKPPPQAGLFVHPWSGGLLLLSWRGSSIAIAELPASDIGEPTELLAQRIAKVAAPLLARESRVDLYLHRSLLALPLDRSLAALLSAATPRGKAVPAIAFAIDAPVRAIGTTSKAAPEACTGRRALLVINPQQNLSAASESAPTVREQLERRGFDIDELHGADVTHDALVERLTDPCVALLHYDGHARTGDPAAGPAHGGAGIDRIDDKLLLANGDTLTAAEVLDLARVPPAIVLNGCTTAAPEGLGISQAFLAAGATQVIASFDELDAEVAAQFTRRLFKGKPAGGSAELDLVSLFARAMAEADVPALRVFER